GIVLTPVFYVVIRGMFERRKHAPAPAAVSKTGAAGAAATLIIAGATALWLSGCAVGPNFKSPKTPVNTSFTEANQTNVLQGEVAVTWWKGFNDATLDRLVDQAVTTNLDLRIATDRIREARALRSEAILTALPIVTANAGYNKTLSSQDSTPVPLTRDQ